MSSSAMRWSRIGKMVAWLGLAAVTACGGGGDDDGVDVDAGMGGDAGVNVCGFARSDFLPYEVGYRWTYRLTDLETGERATKEQRIDPGMEHPDYGPVVVQVTGKINGETISLTRREGGRVLRFQQEDRDAIGALERTTYYTPYQVRLDETADRMVDGAEWDESYTEIVRDPNGVEVTRIDTVDHIEVLAADGDCDSPMGSFSCLRLRRTRLAGGVAEKEFQFVRGVGKIREAGSNQLEELTDCRAE